jgi:predicted secreted protein
MSFKSLFCHSRRFKIGLLIGFLLILWSGFYPGVSFSGGVMKEGHTIILTKQDSGKEIEVRVGDFIQIELQGMGGAGYKWHLQDPGSDCVRFVSEETKVPSQGRVGGPALGIWTFEVMKEGSAEIRMDHYRPWEGIGRSTEHFSVRLHVH